MKKQTLKKRTKKFEEMEDVVNNKERKGILRKGEYEIIVENKDYGITLIALVITVIVLLILARYFN